MAPSVLDPSDARRLHGGLIVGGHDQFSQAMTGNKCEALRLADGFDACAVPLFVEINERFGWWGLDVASLSEGAQVVGGVFSSQRHHGPASVDVSHACVARNFKIWLGLGHVLRGMMPLQFVQ